MRSHRNSTNPYFTRHWGSEFSGVIAAATNVATDTVLLSVVDLLGLAAGTQLMTKAISIVGWTYMSEYIVTAAGQAGELAVVREALVQDSARNDVSEHVATVYLQGTQTVASTASVSAFPDRVLHRRFGDVNLGVVGESVMNNNPIWGLQQTGKRPVRMKPQDVIYWHTEIDNFGNVACTLHQILMGTVTYKVIT